MQGFADGHVAVIGHHRQEEKFCSSKEDNKKYLAEAGIDGDGFVPTWYDVEVRGDTGSCKWDLSERKILKGKIHSCF